MHLRIQSLLALTIALAAGHELLAEQSPDAAKKTASKEDSVYIRVQRNDRGQPTAMETSIVRFASKDRDGIVVDLVGAVHVGDREYYQRLNERFASYDVLLYELVAPENVKVPKGGGQGSGHPIGALQQGMKSMLELAYQLEEVDYTKRNFVHADMTPEEFAKSMSDRGESFLQIMFRMMGQAMAVQAQNPGQSSDAEILFALFAPDRPLRLKRIMADQFENLEGSMSVFDGENGSTLISERNKKALAVLRKQIAKGRKKIGIFYGAGHLPDMAERLEDDFNLARESVTWVEAWDLRGKHSKRPNRTSAKETANP